MSGQHDDVMDQLLRDSVAQCSDWPLLADAPGGPDGTRRFLGFYYRHVAVEELREREPAEVCGPAAAHLAFARHRPQGRAKVRVYTPTREHDGWDNGHTVVEIVTDDAPFLVDSVTMELDRRGIGYAVVIHPQLRVARDVAGHLREIEPGPDFDPDGLVPLQESWMHLEIDRRPDPTAQKELAADLERVLADVHNVDEDTDRMRRQARLLADELERTADSIAAGGVDPAEIRESVAFLRWAADRHFHFMGYREYSLVTRSGEPADSADSAELGLSPRTGTGLGLLRGDSAVSESFALLPPEARAKAREPHVLVLTKANSRATVHRRKYLDYLGVKRFDDRGRVVGEYRFLGLYTHEAVTMSITEIPILARKHAEILRIAGFDPESYDGKDLTEILEGFPREELLQTPVDQLHDIVLNVLRLREKRGTRLFLRRDPYGRYMSCLVYMPRDRYNTDVRLDIQRVLARAFEGATMDHSVMVGSAPFAQLYLVVRAERGRLLAEYDHAALEAEVVAATRSWADDLADELRARFGAARAAELLDTYGASLPEGYKVDTPAATAVDDIHRLDQLGDDELAVNLYRPAAAEPGEWRLKVYRKGDPISLSRVLPLLEHMGVEVNDERPYGVAGPRTGRAWIYDFGLAPLTDAVELPANRLKHLFEEAFTALWHGRGESDRFNALVVRGGLDWRQLTILRAYAKYLRQTGSTFSPAYIADVLVANVHVANLLVRLFESRFDPEHGTNRDERTEAITEEIRGELDQVASLDQDRILRWFLAAIEATLRTNYYQGRADGSKPYLVYKLDPQRIPDLPAPRPRFEMYVYSPRFEGVHLRFGAVARGGLRWSDRFEDFRTEILGLVKAQMVKNSVIVPSGAKGGFVCKRLPAGGDRDAVMAEVVACYKQFISGLLDVTDNLVGGEVQHPDDVVRYDADDSYLVVAADKGTATFSDIANGISVERDFWLGDAFASGGSVGYDHKAMGITARGAWESVKYHFREMGVDIQNEDFTAVGIGDMSGDVFGNGMLLSRHTRLVAAFDHRHVFLDPDPDPERSFAERQRLFDLPRSSWADYDTSLISAGGGVHPRTAKSIPITPQVREALGIDDGVTALAPFELIRHILTAPVDLLWNGGIGTYVKAATESNADVGDKANDPVRVNGAELRCKVVGEGGNLGLTQAGRIEFAKAGGRVNSDFIDNSAGVDTSDHEVNIKIMLDREVREGRLTKAERDELFLSMTDEVADLVLDNNYAQNVVLAAARRQAGAMMHVHARYLRKLERDGRLKRKLETLPDDKEIAARRAAGQGLTGPEFGTVLAYTKNTLKDEIAASDLASDPYLRRTLVDYFPTALRERFADAMPGHPLCREIITNQVVNDMVNRGGTTFAFRINEELGAAPADIARAYLVVREVFGLDDFWRAVEGLDHWVDAGVQLAMLLEARKLIERGARWLLRNRKSPFDLGSEISAFAEGVAELVPQLPKLVNGRDRRSFADRRDRFTKEGVPAELAERVAAMVPAYSTFDVITVAQRTGRSLLDVAEVYFDLAESLQIGTLRERVIALPRTDRWLTMARAALRDDLYAAHSELTREVLLCGEAGEHPDTLRERWLERNAVAVGRSEQTLTEIREADQWDLATLSVALRSVRSLLSAD
ncbi:NAD-glutamate dehydrogenase [Streptomonospora nanhaiensis]|uniref:Glutamate dehydrogenase n=1 Tax=Streptomonospora nanhaiensis TaxID=1323731 RepID=A0A853BNM5_9ACTN|nr:NAD-glutamate dehydrogenase [Streptomonospora nanhaiensis]MBV2362119.1 NAD-glutamate dehydrogenase [Streptomonospora nanhaiensis]MBV2364809.1 NAD-glutamate dehydrogenase [Streptomonospora nanhaiensis]MBX9388572.1 NAD-glutamate dehydrogenase [Streptomonospora nanhaiensis]NYI96052.1 glutamate dehydrogenase [Streptomonospora nanhaiensis]